MHMPTGHPPTPPPGYSRRDHGNSVQRFAPAVVIHTYPACDAPISGDSAMSNETDYGPAGADLWSG